MIFKKKALVWQHRAHDVPHYNGPESELLCQPAYTYPASPPHLPEKGLRTTQFTNLTVQADVKVTLNGSLR